MAFPACSVLEKLYRNSISDVADYLNTQYQGNYLIINVSNRVYDYSKFEDKVRDFEWHDHQAPSLTTLIHIGFSMFNFLRSKSNSTQIPRMELWQSTVTTARAERAPR